MVAVRAAAAAAAVAAACYLGSLHGDLVHDDIPAVRDNPDVRPGERHWTRLWTDDFWGRPMADPASHKSYRPITVLTFRWTMALCGDNPLPFHAVNVLLHAVVTALLVVACDRALRWTPADSLLAGLLFATHPVHAEAVASVVGRAELLAALFFLCSFLSFARWTDGCSSWWFLACAVHAALALLAKEQGITVLPVCAAYQLALAWDQRKYYPHCRSAGRVLAVIVVFLLFFKGRMWMLHGQLPVFSEQDNPAAFSDSLLTRFLTYCYLAAFNAGLLLAPVTLSYDWQSSAIPLVQTWLDLRNTASLALFLGLALLLRRLAARRVDCALALAFLILPFLPASNIPVTVGFVVAERVLYLPSMGWCLLVTAGVGRLRRRSWLPPRACKLATCGLLVLLALRSVRRNHDWLSREALFTSGLKSAPQNAKVHYNYANLQKDLGNLELSRHHYRMALRLWPDYASAHNNLGTVVGDSQEAEAHFRRALAINPQHARALYNLGNLCSKNESRRAEAERLLRQALVLEDLPEAYSTLAGLYQARGLLRLAEMAHRQVLRLDPRSADAHNNYGTFLQKMGRTEEAVAHYERAMELQPDHTVALVNAARALGDSSRAEVLLKRALEVSGPSPALEDSLGLLYLRSGRTAAASALYSRLTLLHPDFTEAKLHFAQVLSAQRRLYQAESVLLQALRAPNDTSSSSSTGSGASHRGALLHQLSVVYARMNRTSEALDAISEALGYCHPESSTSRECGQLHSHHADLLKDLHDYRNAAQSYRLAVELDPSLSHAFLNLAVIEHLQGHFQAAKLHYKAAERLDPSNPLLRENMAKLNRASSCCMFR